MRVPDYSGERWRLYVGDCLETMREMEAGSVDAVVTDPPFDAKTHAGGMTRNAGAGGSLDDVSAISINFEPLADFAWLDEAFRVSRGWVLAFCSLEMLGDYAAAAGSRWVRAGIWNKPNSAPQFTGDRPAQACEGIAIMHTGGKKEWSGGGGRAFWNHPIESRFLSDGPRCHPTQKPLALMEELVRLFTPTGGIVLDTHCGSGTTGKAAISQGFSFVGCELSPDYAQIAARRIGSAPLPLDFDSPAEPAPTPKDAPAHGSLFE
jgi:site-specific DNA-methyltransferase (adenine-specific)